MIVGTELVVGRDTDPAVADFIEAFSKVRLGREMIRTADTPAFAGNRVGFKVLNEAAQLAEEHGPLLVDRLVGPYTGRALTPLATIDLVGWDIHRAIVDNVYENSDDEAHATLKLPDYMAKLMGQGVLGNKSGGGFFRRDGKTRQVLDPATGDYRPESEVALPDLGYIDAIASTPPPGALSRGAARTFWPPRETKRPLARKVVAGYIAYALERVGEVTETTRRHRSHHGHGLQLGAPRVC